MPMAAFFDIEHLVINEDRSSLESVRGKRVGRLEVHICGSQDAEHIAACKNVDRLELWGWKEPDLTSIHGVAVKYLRLVRGRQTSVKGLSGKRLKLLQVHSCGQVRELDIPRLPSL